MIDARLTMRTMKLADLKPAKYNPRRIDDAAMAGLEQSMTRFGVVEPIIFNAKSGVVVGGHQRLKVLRSQKVTETDVVVVELDEIEEKALNVALNSPHLSGEFTADLQAILEEVMAANEEMFHSLRLGELLGETISMAPLADPDDVPDVPAVAITQMGDVYVLGRHRLVCGDSTTISAMDTLMVAEKADMVFTDPPYGVNYDGGHAVKGKRRVKLANDESANIYAQAMPIAFAYSRNDAPLYLWFSDSKSASVIASVTDCGYEIRNTLIWNKNLAQFGAISAQYKSKHEPCLYCFKAGMAPFWAGPTNEVSVWEAQRATKNEFHPTQKPTALATRAIENSSPDGAIILDLFGGSGSTMIACEQANRRCRMIEIDPLYCDVIVQRWQTFTGKLAVRQPAGNAEPLAPSHESGIMEPCPTPN